MSNNRAYLSIGSNYQAVQNINKCIRLLHQYTSVVAVSPVYETTPVGEAAGNYLNMAVIIETSYDPVNLKDNVLRRIEAELGRERGRTQVTIDLDVVLFNNEQHDLGKRTIPDPALYQYAFVAIPLADVAPDYVHPVTGEALRTIADRFSHSSDVKRRDDIVSEL